MTKQFVWLAIGLLALACGIAGVILPLVPTTPFLLVAAFAFARSSPTLHDWLVSHPELGSSLRHWNEHGAITKRAKASAAVLMAGTLLVSGYLGASNLVLALQSMAMLGVGAFILSRPHGPEQEV
jgi:uncharacterized membrane protein YbaN (DUF454 family)